MTGFKYFVMRITGGQFSGRVIRTPKQGVRPTQERVREALFSSLGASLVGARVLDCFAGTGALGLEAWSRGAAQVEWVESDARTFVQLKANVTTLCGAAAARNCHRADVMTYLKRCADPETGTRGYDFILADPPYATHTRAFDWNHFLHLVDTGAWLKPDGAVLIEERAGSCWTAAAPWLTRRDRVYGHTRLRWLVLSSHND